MIDTKKLKKQEILTVFISLEWSCIPIVQKAITPNYLDAVK